MMAREMKDSGIQWVGEIPKDWTVYRNKVLFSCAKEIVGDKSESTQLLSLTTQGIKKKSQNDVGGKVPGSFDTYQMVEPDDIVMCLFDLDCSAVFSGISHDFGMISPAYKVIKCNELILPEYADYWFRFAFAGRKYMSYAKNLRFTLNYDEFSAILTATPPINKQSEIVRFLNARCHEIDAVLDKTRVSIEEYKKLKQAIITQAVTKGIHGGRPMRESGIEWAGTIPEGIKISRVGLHYDIILGKMLCSSQVDDSYTLEPYYCAADIHFEGISDDERKMMWFGPSERELYLVKEGDLLVVEGGAGAGGCAIVIDTGTPTYIQNSIMIVRPKNSRDCRYLRYLLECFVKQGYIDVVCNKATIPHFTKDKLGCVPYFVFSEKEKEEISDYLDEQCGWIDAIVKKKEQYLVEIEQYKNSLIYEFVTGKKEVPLEQEQYIQEIIVYPHFPAALQVKSPRFAQAVLMSKVLDECRTKMGRVKLEKMMFVLENSIGFDFDTEYVREAAGPLDKSIYTCEGMISRSNKWYIITPSRYGVSYRPAKDQQKYKNYYEKYFGEHDAEIERIIGIFKDYSTDQAEIIATLYGAWNDFIIDKRSYTDDDIVDEVLTNWNDSKKRFSKDVWLRAIQKMRELALVPHGYGRHTVSKGEKGCG